MIILSHRGYWLEAAEKNTPTAFLRSFELGFGTETDVRDLAGELVISHDPPKGGEMSLAAYLRQPGAASLPQAINVKADGLARLIAQAMREAGATNWFVFDMSVPDTLMQLKEGNPVFIRMSEYEPEPPLLEQAAGVWLDAFEGRWWDCALIERIVQRGKQVCIVSPELHKRPHLATWEALRPLAGLAGVMLCTDVPEAAQAFFGGQS